MELADLKEIPAGQGIDFEEFEGKRVKIEEIKPIEVKTDYDEAGNLRPGLQRQVWVLRIATESIVETENKDGEKVVIRASELCSLKKNGDGQVGWSDHPDAKIQKILKKYKAKSPSDLIGKTVTVNVREKAGKQFLGIVY